MLDLDDLDLPELFRTLTGDGSLTRLLEAARAEDLGPIGDVTTASIVDPDTPAVAMVTARQRGVVAGLPVVEPVLGVFGSLAGVEPAARDGDPCNTGDVLARIRGALAPILMAERTVLNLLSHLCGIASMTRQYADAVEGTRAVICDTRKTTPGLRALEKYAVRCGGGTLHRLGLHDAALYKDNHLAGLGPREMAAAVARAAALARGSHELRFVEVEVETLDQLEAVLALEPGTIDIVLLDNMTTDTIERAVALRDRHAEQVLLEASGGVRLERVREIAAVGVDRISVGAITHGAPSMDIALDIQTGDRV